MCVEWMHHLVYKANCFCSLHQFLLLGGELVLSLSLLASSVSVLRSCLAALFFVQTLEILVGLQIFSCFAKSSKFIDINTKIIQIN